MRYSGGTFSEITMSPLTVIIFTPAPWAASASTLITRGLFVLKVLTYQAFSGVVERCT